MCLAQAVRWEEESHKEIARRVPITSVPAGHNIVSTRWVFKVKAKGTYKGRLVVQGFSQIPGVSTPGVGPELSLNQPEKMLNEEEKRRYPAITRVMMYLAHVIRYGILYVVNQLARAMSKVAKAHTGVAKHPSSPLCQVHRLLHHLPAGRLPAFFLLGSQLGQHFRQRQVCIFIHRDAGLRPDQLQGGTVGADHTVHDGSRARDGSSDNEGGDVILQRNAGAGLGCELRQRATAHKQHYNAARRQQPHLQCSRKAHRAEVLFSYKKWCRREGSASTTSRARIS